MKKALLFVCLILITHLPKAQDLEYETIKDDPDGAVSKLYLGLEPIFLDINGTNGFAMGFGAYAHYHIKQNLMFQARFQTPYYKGILDGAWLSAADNKLQEPDNGYFNDYDPAKLMYFDFTASMKLLRFDRQNRPVKIWLSTGGTDMNNYIDGAFATKRYQLMARAGLLMRNSVISMDRIPGENNNWPSYTGDPYTNMNSVSLYAGASLNKMWEMVANITELDIGRKIARMHKSYYIDLMFAPVMNFRDMEKDGQTRVVTDGSLADGYLDKNRLGVRFGMANMPEYKNNLSGWEIGVFPSWESEQNSLSGLFWRWWWILDVYSSED